MTERWLPVVGYEGLYSVSDYGRVRSESRVVMRSNGRPQTCATRVLKQSTHHRSGHKRVPLNRAGTQKTVNVHQLVLAAFIGPCPPGQESLHWDDVPSNNKLSNLRYGTPSDNMFDRVRNGKHHGAKQTHCRRGHEFTLQNTLLSSGRRRCRACIALHRQGKGIAA